MLTFHYKSKKELKENIGKALSYSETSMFGEEYRHNGSFLGTNHPKRSWFAKVEMENGLIKKVS